VEVIWPPELIRLRPNAASNVCRTAAKWFDPDHLEHLVAGWRKAGLQIPDEKSSRNDRNNTK